MASAREELLDHFLQETGDSTFMNKHASVQQNAARRSVCVLADACQRVHSLIASLPEGRGTRFGFSGLSNKMADSGLVLVHSESGRERAQFSCVSTAILQFFFCIRAALSSLKENNAKIVLQPQYHQCHQCPGFSGLHMLAQLKHSFLCVCGV